EKLITHNGTEKLFEMEIRRKGGDIAIVEFNIIPIMENSKCNYLWIFTRDLTEFYKLKDKTEQKTKMEAMGKVTGKVAHDFNNILTGIIGYSDMIINNPNGADKTIIEYAKNINRAGLSAKNLIKDLLLFSKNQKLNKEVFDLNKLIIEYTNILKGTIKKNISLKLDLDNEECIIDADKTKIESVLLNLITNAIDSIETEGIIKIKTRHKIENDSSYIILTVEDNGKGIPENIINRIYEPFFSTKREGKGTGLGLSIVYGIVMQHNGSISVRSKLNKGTTFEIAIPEFKSFSENNPSISDRKKKEMRKILLVDDDENSLDVITNMLKTLGYDVETADSAYNGLNLYKNNSDRYDLVIADYILPGMNGFEMLKDIQEINPALKAIIVSGYINDTSFLDNNEFVILIKPFTIDELSKVIKNLLK
ncbi:response regulator, partial [candidate division WOR-3 bacterium]|nr:response regulator [candidate division WOR-3 bacterium]